eukprot:jgi/Ulvmu1/10895/UM007_0072.1
MARIIDGVQANEGSVLEDVVPLLLPMEWHFLQCFGQPNAAEMAPNADLLSALKFNHSGEYLATGDKGGRIVLLQQTEGSHAQQPRPETPEDGRWMLPMEFHYLTEFQAHQSDFDFLKSVEIPERINSISWLQNCGSTHMLLSANDKQVKLWKIYERTMANVANYNHSMQSVLSSAMDAPMRVPQLRVPRVVNATRSLDHRCKREYDANAHLYFINSVSSSPDQGTFISSDDLCIHLWNLEHADGNQVILDMRPLDQDYTAPVHVITSAAFHPTNGDLLAYSTSKTVLSIMDLRQKDVRGDQALTFQEAVQNGPNPSLAELVAAPSNFELARDGVHAVTRDYMHACLWDVRSSKQPLHVFHVHEQLRNRLVDVYDNEAIFDRLGCSISPCGKHVVAGTYGEVAVFSSATQQFSTLRTCISPSVVNGQTATSDTFPGTFKWKVENVAWHPSRPLVVATALNSLFTFCARPAAPL